MVKGPSLRRSGQQTTSEADSPPDHQPAGYETRVEKAAERAAAATRTAAASAAAERAHARPRTSVLASLSLVLSVVAVLAVATGTLAGLGIAVGVLALVLGFAGLAATGHHYRYLAGRAEATIALLLALAAIVVGALAAAGTLAWLDTDTDQVARLRELLPDWLG